ncbi:2-oxoadipate dioxygenase/decarboxylase family protein [Rhodococcus sp. NPDC056960]|uniref:2-oxoadipate dioxygenase/decarboxylase family protein n=1 Tax=Rhodococcus sp. NPDC056960 TaxID=3345982 RepID=UPI0036445B23
MVETWELRDRFARALAATYGREVPAYGVLVEVADAVNADFAARTPADAERFGGLSRVAAERRGAIRLAGPAELRQAAILFAGFGMHPVGCYDRRDASTPAPVVATTFRPVDPMELARNPFGMFASMLVTADRRFFGADLQRRVENLLAARTVFSTELLHLAALAAEEGGLTAPSAERFVALAATVFDPQQSAADRSWHVRLRQASPVAAAIGGRTGVPVVHLAPRVFDLDDLCARSAERGLATIDGAACPPARRRLDVLVRHASFHALADPDRIVVAESRGVALTPEGRELFDRPADADAADAEREFPRTDAELEARGFAYFTHRRVGGERVREPIVYEDYLPVGGGGPDHHLRWLAETLGRPVTNPFTLYRRQQDATRERTAS